MSLSLSTQPAMSGNGNIDTQTVGEEQSLDVAENEVNLDQIPSRPVESARSRACVLLGSAILQLPIWGMRKHRPTWSLLDPHLPIQVSP